MKKDAYIGKKGFGQVYTYLLIFVLLITACSKTEGAKDVSGETASLSVTLKGQSIESKAVAPTGEPELQALKEAENALKNVVVFVFNANGILDKKHNFSPSAVTGRKRLLCWQMFRQISCSPMLLITVGSPI